MLSPEGRRMLTSLFVYILINEVWKVRMDQDQLFMKRALELSKYGASLTHPNPMVGAVIVKNGQIISEGWHHGPGLPHAEIEALRACKEDPRGATMYVTLEPCNHWGRTPPCTKAIIESGIAKVKVAARDNNCQVTGRGIEQLVAAGIQVETGLCQDEALMINHSFYHHCQTGHPWVIMKSATSLDGKITTSSGESHWITGEASRRQVHQLRSQVGAVLVGSGTMLQDDPELTNRLYLPVDRQPLKVLLDSELKVLPTHQLVRNAPERLLVFCNERASDSKEKTLQNIGVRIFRQSGVSQINLTDLLETLGQLEIRSILIEGGAETFASFLREDLVAEFYLFYAPFFIGGIQAKGVIGGNGIDTLQNARRLKIESITQIGEDIMVHAFKLDSVRTLQFF